MVKPTEPRLTLDVVPATCHYSNLRTELPRQSWNRLRAKAYFRARYRCEVCGGRGPEHPVEAHEQWAYEIPDDHSQMPTQRLTGIIALCPDCHEVKHYGLAQVRGREAEALAYLCRVNGYTDIQAEEAIYLEAMVYRARSTLLWRLDVSLILEMGESELYVQEVMDRRDAKNAVVAAEHVQDLDAFIQIAREILAVPPTPEPEPEDSTDGFKWV